MIRCYEAKLSKNLNPRVRSFIMKEWMEKRNTYGIELKKYIIDLGGVDTVGFDVDEPEYTDVEQLNCHH